MSKKKEKYFITSINGEKYYTTDKNLAQMRDKYIDWDNLQGTPVLLFMLSFIFVVIPACYMEENEIFPWWCWLLSAIAVLIVVMSIVFGCVLSKKIDKYSKYDELFFKTKEYTRQYNKYRKLEKEKKDRELKEKATDLVEIYEILDNQNMPKETKIELLMSYIDRRK